MTDWAKTLPDLLNLVWRELNRGATSHHAAARLVVLASVDATANPRARMVALRQAHQPSATIRVHTDAATPKVTELRANPQAAIHLWIEHLQLQIRLNGTTEILTDSAVDVDWARIPMAARGNYGVMPAPGTPIPQTFAYDRTPDREKFAVLSIHITEIDVVHLGEPLHRRALFLRTTDWAGQWLAP